VPIQTKSPARKSWRDVLAIHPAADLFPLMSDDKLRSTGEDIVKNGLKLPIALWRAHPKGEVVLLDGRNRLDAIEIATGKTVEVGAPSIMAGDFLACDKVIELDGRVVDPYDYAMSANFHRRDLTIEEQQEAIAKLIKADPTKSNRQIAKLTDRSHPYIAKVKRELEKAGDVETVSTSIDTKGRKQPSRKPWSKERRARELCKHEDARNADLAAINVSMTARLNACTNDLRNLEIENRRLANENAALRDELAKVNAELDEIIAAQANDDVPPPADDDGLGIPDFLDRTKTAHA
jgi:hypothetical protein